MKYEEHPFCTIVPPHVLEHIAQRGSDAQKAAARRTLTLSAQFRGRRDAFGDMAAAATPAGALRRTIYDAQHKQDLPGLFLRGEGDQATKDDAADEAYDGAGATYKLYAEVYDRNSVDDRGMRLDASVHFGVDYDNAFWDGRQMVYGDGDGVLFQRFTRCIDVIGHELTHGVVQFEANLAYWDQPGALNESFADVFGSLLKQRVLNQTADQADWLIGAGLLAAGVNGKALRSMKEPGTAYDDPVLGKDPQPAHMRDYVETNDDNGGVHINSGIPNHAFYVVATEIGGYAWEKAGQVWYIALRDRLRRRSTFRQAANMTYHVAAELFGADSREQRAVRKGWESVGITVK